MKNFFIAAAFVLAFCGVAQAKDWQVDYTHSALTFTGEQSGEKFEGGFKKFTAQISLDPDHPESGKINVTVDTSSAFAGDKDRDAMLPQADWFNVGAFPQAQFVSTAIHKTGAGQYEADAKLTIKGVTQDVALPFTLVQEGDHWHAQGHVVLNRGDFSLGQGNFANENYVKFAVDVAVDIIAK